MIDVVVTEAHYVDHLAPIWWALPDRLRGVWYAERSGYRKSMHVGLDPVRSRRPPSSDRLTLVASHADERYLRRPVVLVEHGVGQHYDGVDASSLGQPRGNVVGYLAPNHETAERMASQFPEASVHVVGCPKLDRWVMPTRDRIGRYSGAPVVGLSWHWDGRSPETKSAFRQYRHAIPKLADRIDGQVVGHAHPRIWEPMADFYRRNGIEPIRDFGDVLARVHVYACDNSSTMFEAAALGIPVVVLNAPWYRRDVDHGIRFWQWANIGPQVDHPADLAAAIEHAWAERDWYADFRHDMRAALFPNLGWAADVAAVALKRIYAESYDAAMDGG